MLRPKSRDTRISSVLDFPDEMPTSRYLSHDTQLDYLRSADNTSGKRKSLRSGHVVGCRVCVLHSIDIIFPAWRMVERSQA
jgi:hypothetical protein